MTASQKYHPQASSRSTRVDIRGVNYHVYEWGSHKQPLLFMLHGWGDCGASFQFVVDELQEDWFVVAPDWRGFGRSRIRCTSYWFPDYLADLHVLLAHYQSDKPVHLLGHSMGANIAGLYAGIFPDRVASFVNVEGFGLVDSKPDNAPANYRKWIEQSQVMPEYSTYSSYKDLADRILKRSPNLATDRALYVAQQWASEDDDGRIVLRADPAHKLPNAIQYRRAEAAACWENVSAPVLLIAGEDSAFSDALSPLIDASPGARPFPNQQTATISGCGHMVHFEQPRRLAQAVESFVSSVT